MKSLKPLSEGTREIYTAYLDEFLEYNQSTPRQFFEWVHSLEMDKDPRAKKQLTDAYNDFAKTKLDDGVSINTVSNYRKAVHKFLSANELTARIKTNNRKPQYEGQDTVTKDQIKKLIDLAATNLRLRALLMTAKDTGLGVSEIAALTVEDYLNAMELKDEAGSRFKMWSEPISRAKTGEKCHICLGPESIAAVEDYLGFRRTGPLFTMSKGIPHKDENGNMNPDKGYTEKGDPITPSAITTSIRHHCRVLKRKGYKVSAHSFRKLFETSFAIEGLIDLGKYIMGKAIPPSDKPYLKFKDKTLGKYIEVYNKHLRLYGESAEMRNLKKRQQQYDEEVSTLRDELNAMRQQLTEIYQTAAPKQAPTPEEYTLEELERVKLLERVQLTVLTRTGYRPTFEEAEKILTVHKTIEAIREYYEKLHNTEVYRVISASPAEKKITYEEAERILIESGDLTKKVKQL